MKNNTLVFLIIIFFPFYLFADEQETITKSTVLKSESIKDTKYFCVHYPIGTKVATQRANGTFKAVKFQNVKIAMIKKRDTNKARYLSSKTRSDKRKYKKLYNKFKKAYNQIVTCQNFKTAKYACDYFNLEKDNQEKRGIYPRVLNGEPCDALNSVVAKVKMIYENGNFGGCTGTLIKKDVVLTAAHCLAPDNDDGLVVQVSITIGGKTYDVKSWYFNPLFSEDTVSDADTGLVFLSKKTSYKPMPLVKKGTSAKNGDVGAIIGYGITKFNFSKNDKRDFYVDGFQAGFAIIAQATDMGILSKYKNTDGTANTCNGDSGGPIAIYQDGQWRLFGTTSWGDDQYCGYLSGHENSWWSKVDSEKNSAFIEEYLGNIYSK